MTENNILNSYEYINYHTVIQKAIEVYKYIKVITGIIGFDSRAGQLKITNSLSEET